MASVRAAAASGEIAPDVFNAIEKIYKLYPNVLEGIRRVVDREAELHFHRVVRRSH